MDRSEIIDVLRKIEADYPVDNWMIDDVYVWPLIKMNIFSRWKKAQNNNFSNLLKTQEVGTGAFTRIFRLLTSLFFLLQLTLQRKRKVGVIFLGTDTYRTNFREKYINRYFEPLAEYLNEEANIESLSFEYKQKDGSKVYSDRNEIIFVDKYSAGIKFLRGFKSRKLTVNIDKFEEFIEFINFKAPNLSISRSYLNQLKQVVKDIQNGGYLFEYLFKKYSVKVAISLCYYNMKGYSLNYAASKSEVISIDMQHGGLGPLHPAYSDYYKIPAKGYNLLPTVFWCWDKSSSNVITKWTNGNPSHMAVVGGNPWLPYFLGKSDESYSFPDRKIILYTLQLSEPEEYIIQAIKDTPEGYEWWLRMHPRTIDNKDHLKSLLAGKGLSNKVDVDKATQYPLPHILSNAAIHISRFSGSIIEAAQLGVKTIIIDPLGITNYSEYIHQGQAVAFLDGNSDGLISLILEHESEINSEHEFVDYKLMLNKYLINNHPTIANLKT